MSASPAKCRGSAGNLVPRVYLRQLRLHCRRRAWVAVVCAYAVLALVYAGTYWLLRAAGPAGTDAELSAQRARNEETRSELQRLANQLALLRDDVEQRQNLVSQPDFSILLRFLSDAVDRDTMFRHFSLRGTGIDPLRPGAVPGGPRSAGFEREPRHFVLSLSGTSRSETGLTRLSGRLRDSGLFDRVELRRTGRDLVGPDEAMSFEIECILLSTTPTAEATPQPSAPTPLPSRPSPPAATSGALP